MHGGKRRVVVFKQKSSRHFIMKLIIKPEYYYT